MYYTIYKKSIKTEWLKAVISAAFILLFSFDPAYPEKEKINIAIMDLESEALSKMETNTLTNELRGQIIKLGFFNVIERDKMQALLAEQGFQQSELCNTDDCFAQMGKMVGVRQVIVGEIGKVGSIYMLSVRFIDVNSGQILIDINEKEKGTIEDILLKLVPRVVQQIGDSMLRRQQRKGSALLSITCNVPDAEVFINGRSLGKAPVENIKLDLNDYKLEVSKEGYDTYTGVAVLDIHNDHKKMEITLNRKTRKRAAMLSATCPGRGQLYFGEKKRAMIVAGAEAFLLLTYVAILPSYAKSVKEYKDAKAAYDGGTIAHDPVNEAYEKANGRYNLLLTVGLLFVTGWGYNVIDAMYVMPDKYGGDQAAKEEKKKLKAFLEIGKDNVMVGYHFNFGKDGDR